MKSLMNQQLLLVVFLLGSCFHGNVLAQEIECQSRSFSVKALSSDVRTTTVNFNTDENGVPDSTGFLDPDPLLSTTVTVGRRGPRCLIVHFSAMAEPLDNFIMFQVQVDGIPMQGHAIFPFSVPLIENPVVWSPEETDQNLTRMVSYHFFEEVERGDHVVEVFFAGCCGDTSSGNTIATVRSSVLTVQF